jgi:hypothetical protein
MRTFFKRWYKEFKNEQAIKNHLQSTMMTNEDDLDSLKDKESSHIYFDEKLFNLMTYGDEYKTSDD